MSIHNFKVQLYSLDDMTNFFTEYFNSVLFIYEFGSDGQVRLFNQRKRMFFYIMIPFAIYETAKTLFNGYMNDNNYRYYLSDFQVTWTTYQNIFNFSIFVAYFFLLRLCVYFILNDKNENTKRFQYMNFFR